MANVIISPNMNLPIPVVSIDPGPDWANNVNACLNAIDSHNHAPGYGVQIQPNGLDISSDLPFNGNSATQLGSSVYATLSATLTTLYSVYVVGSNLYYTNGAGTAVQITNGSSVNAGAGSITGLPSGTASASFAAGTFTFQQSTSTPATLNVGTVVIGQEVSSGFNVTLAASGSQGANYNLTLPTALPGSTSIVQLDNSGNISASNALSGTYGGNPTFSGNMTVNGNFTNLGTAFLNILDLNSATVEATNCAFTVTGASFSGVPNFVSGAEFAGGGTAATQSFKTALYSGSIVGNTNTAITKPGTVYGVSGFFINSGAGSNGVIGTTLLGASGPTSGTYFTANSGSTILVSNKDSTTATYTVIIFYQ